MHFTCTGLNMWAPNTVSIHVISGNYHHIAFAFSVNKIYNLLVFSQHLIYVSQYFSSNYISIITKGLCQKKKIETGGGGWGWGHTFLKNAPIILDLSGRPYKFWRKQAFIPGNSAKLFDTPWKFQHQKPTPMEIPHIFFNTLGISTYFLIDPWNFHMLFLQYPWKFHVLNPIWIFSRTVQLLAIIEQRNLQ